MTLDEAIKHCEEVANDKADLACTLWDSKEKARCEECANEHKQLAEWLKELKAYKGQDGDTIDRQAAIRIASGYCHPANIAAELAKLPPAQSEQRWIPCSERLPDYDEDVLTCSESGYVEIQRLEKGYYWEYQYGGWTTDLHEVIAWMPLPSSYQGE